MVNGLGGLALVNTLNPEPKPFSLSSNERFKWESRYERFTIFEARKAVKAATKDEGPNP